VTDVVPATETSWKYPPFVPSLTKMISFGAIHWLFATETVTLDPTFGMTKFEVVVVNALTPVAPVGPVGPVCPVGPVGPVGPVAP
jgi:hypothetical protein